MPKLEQENFSRETYIEPSHQEIKPKGEYLDFNQVPEINNPLEKMETLARSFSRENKSMSILEKKERDEASIGFQQDTIRYLINVGEDSNKVEELWKDYDQSAYDYARECTKELSDDKARKKRQNDIEQDFEFLKTSIIGSTAVVRFFQEQGLEVKFPIISEDRSKKCDLIIESPDKKFVFLTQVKSSNLLASSPDKESEIAERLILIDVNKIDEEERDDFRILEKYCRQLSQKSGKSYLPIFIEMPISKESNERGVPKKQSLVDKAGFLNERLNKSMGIIWEQRKKEMGLDRIGQKNKL